jgi:hypothetical protein
MNKNLKIALIIAGIIALIYFWNKKKSDESEKSEFLGFFKKGSQTWANRLANKYCKLIARLTTVVAQMNVAPNIGLTMEKNRLEAELEAILRTLRDYGYEIDVPSCKAIKSGGASGKAYKPGDKIGADCLCKDKRTWGPECCKSFK